ncbi:putative quinol monooxygenase [Blastococcus sp. TF02A-26]|uniref:putative quinol monooxygenase n=1 Tax=Blastococcus sp. TF02A-26 TaxID=2250577 RepID=UPI000DEA1CF8|nr:putative quinol monooxygenase [Blastococcus sp. TF02A-26]RBY82251.1 antibiotic biosynthesis monooxygenase [Blastococcus sp. TF02A-26]
MILIVVKFPVRPELVETWPELVRDYTEGCRAEEGNLFFDWSRSVEEPDTYVLVEGFRDAAAGAAHVGTDHFKAFVERGPDLVARQPQIIYIDAPEVDGFGPMGEIQPRG